VPGSLDKKEGRRCHLLLRKRWHLLPPFLPNKPGTDIGRAFYLTTVELYNYKIKIILLNLVFLVFQKVNCHVELRMQIFLNIGYTLRLLSHNNRLKQINT
jgi:hypothetical protein